MKVLIACEFSGVARRAFTALGHDAWSCDLLPAEDGSNHHIVCDVRDILGDGWDLLMVAHPPCTRLCRSGRRWLSGPGNMTHPKKLPTGRTWASMKEEFENGVDLFKACWQAPIAHIAIENPEMHDLAVSRMPGDLPLLRNGAGMSKRGLQHEASHLRNQTGGGRAAEACRCRTRNTPHDMEQVGAERDEP